MPSERILGLGEVLWDLLPDGPRLGGAPANFAYHARCHGAEAALVSAVGKDQLGQKIVEQMSSLGVDCRHVAQLPGVPTGIVRVSLGSGGAPSYDIATGVAWDEIPLTDELLLSAGRADAVCFGSLAQRAPASRRTIRAVLDATPRGCLRVFDINLRKTYFDREVIDESLKRTSVLKLNHEELPVVRRLLGLTDDDRGGVGELFGRYGLQMIALTRGAAGSTLFTPHQQHDQPAVSVTVADSVGAGDSFTAALVVGLLRRVPLPETHAAAARVAAYVCTQPGATPAVPREYLIQ